jgi:hypothetical protein
MQLVSCQNLSKIDRNYQSNMLVATVVSYCAFADLVPHHSPKLERDYLKTEARVQVATKACWGGSGRVQTTVTMVIVEAVHACGRWCSNVWWSKLMVEWIVVAGADNGGSVHASVSPTLSSRANDGVIRSSELYFFI